MTDVQSDETRLANEIDKLKTEFPKTRELYREVCALMFFRFGLTPTANRLYQLVKRGSMSTPTQVLGEFWSELRDKSRVRIEHPDLPPDLQAAAGELVATLWTRSSAAAQAALEALRVEVEAGREAAAHAVAVMQAELKRTETALEQRTGALLNAQVRIQELEQTQAASEATRRALEGETARLLEENAASDRALAQSRADFSAGLEKLRADAERAEARLQAGEKRALLEIDHERSQAVRLQKELDAAARRGEQRDAQQRIEAEALQTQLGDARHSAGLVQGRLDSIEATHAASQRELNELRQQLATNAKHSTAPNERSRIARRPGVTAKKTTLARKPR